MNDHSDLHEGTGHISDEMAGNGKVEPLETRLRRLESALAAMQDTKLMEERLMERVMNRMDQPMPPQARLASSEDSTSGISAGLMAEAGKALLPSAMRAFSSELHTATNPKAGQAPSSVLSPQNWLLTDLIFDIRTFIALYVDYRYHPSWSAKTIPPIGLILMVIIYFLLTTIPMVLVDLFLIMVVYKTLLREANRYRAMLPYLPARIS